MMKHLLGIDIGGSKIKGALVDPQTGQQVSHRYEVSTPQPSTPKNIGAVLSDLVQSFHWKGPIGCTFPAVVHHGVTYSAANVDRGWLNAPAQAMLSDAIGQPLLLLNDADAAGIAEARFGAACDVKGKCLVLTFGTGIGSALLHNGDLIRNTELGHLQFNGMPAEHYCAARVKTIQKLTWKAYALRLSDYLQHLQIIFSPDLIIIGGGISCEYRRLSADIAPLRCPVLSAKLENDAGIIGAAIAAAEHF